MDQNKSNRNFAFFPSVPSEDLELRDEARGLEIDEAKLSQAGKDILAKYRKPRVHFELEPNQPVVPIQAFAYGIIDAPKPYSAPQRRMFPFHMDHSYAPRMQTFVKSGSPASYEGMLAPGMPGPSSKREQGSHAGGSSRPVPVKSKARSASAYGYGERKVLKSKRLQLMGTHHEDYETMLKRMHPEVLKKPVDYVNGWPKKTKKPEDDPFKNIRAKVDTGRDRTWKSQYIRENWTKGIKPKFVRLDGQPCNTGNLMGRIDKRRQSAPTRPVSGALHPWTLQELVRKTPKKAVKKVPKNKGVEVLLPASFYTPSSKSFVPAKMMQMKRTFHF